MAARGETWSRFSEFEGFSQVFLNASNPFPQAVRCQGLTVL